MHAQAGLLALLGSSGLVAAAPTFGWLPSLPWLGGGSSGGYGSSSPAYTPPAYTPPSYTPPAYTPPSYTPPTITTPKYTPPAYTPPAYTPPAYTPPTTTPKYSTPTGSPPVYTPPGGYGSGKGLNPIGWLGGIVGGITGTLTGVLSHVFDITLFFGKKFDIEITLADKTTITKSVSYLGSTSLGELKVEHILVADVDLHFGFLNCEFKFKEDVEVDAIFGITSGWSHTYGKGNYGKYGSSAPAGVSAGATIKWLTVIGIECSIAPPSGWTLPTGYTPPSGGKPYSYNPPKYY